MPDESLPTETLIRNAKSDPAAIDPLLARYRPLLGLVAKGLVSPQLASREDSSDIVRETLFRITETLGTFRGTTEREFSAWVNTILENVAKDLVRRHIVAERRSVNREQPMITSDGSASLHWYELADKDNSDGSNVRVVSGERALILAAKIEELSPPQREAIRLRYLEHCSIEQIAQQMDKSRDAVSALIYRGTAALKKALPRDF